MDMSIKENIAKNWNGNDRRSTKNCDVAAAIYGEHTDSASGVSAELKIAQEEGIPYFLLGGRINEVCIKPVSEKTLTKYIVGHGIA